MAHHANLPVPAHAAGALILHNYPASPFAEKARLVCGYKKLGWTSVLIPMVMPKPELVALTGGYRKTPVLQIGADIYCDTALICDVLEQLQPEPTLYPVPHQGVARILAQWADHSLFWAAMGHNFSAAGAAQLFQGGPPDAGKAFAEDRAKMRLAIPRLGAGDATAAYRSYLRRLANMLDGQRFLLGQEPSLADFACYHPLWFTRRRTSAMAAVFDATPVVLQWMDRMEAFSSKAAARLDAAEAIAIAARSTPAALPDAVFQDEHGIPLGTEVSIASDSFGPEATTGELLAATRMHYTLRRTDERAGTVHVHFPRIGYVMRAVRKT